MSFARGNIKTAIIFMAPEEQNIDSGILLFKVAFSYALKGLSVCILINPNKDKLKLEEKYLLFPEILKRIYFRYIKTCQGVIEWCHEVHYLPKKPSMLLIPIDHFCKSEDFEIISICTALVDAVMYLSTSEKPKQCHFLAVASIDFNNYLPYLHSYFNYSWLSKNINSSVYLNPYTENNESNKAFQFVICNNSTHDDIRQIFEGYPKTFLNVPL